MIQRGQWHGAAQQLRAILQQTQGHAEAYELLGIACSQINKRDEAREAFENAIRFGQNRVSAHYNFALFLANINEIEQANEEILVALYIAPDHAGALALQKKLSQQLQERRYTSEQGFAVVTERKDALHHPDAKWAGLLCNHCGASNFITARICVRCGHLIEDRPIQPVE
jgi:Flp pilus assembly protein TadD